MLLQPISKRRIALISQPVARGIRITEWACHQFSISQAAYQGIFFPRNITSEAISPYKDVCSPSAFLQQTTPYCTEIQPLSSRSRKAYRHVGLAFDSICRVPGGCSVLTRTACVTECKKSSSHRGQSTECALSYGRVGAQDS